MKRCGGCGDTKGQEEFHRNSGMPDGLSSQCKLCRCDAEKRRRLAKPELARRREVARRHGLTLEEVDGLRAVNGPARPGCGEPRPLQVDHDHGCCPGKGSCGKCVRGLLCSGCNRAVGYAGDSPAILANLISYLNDYLKGN